MSKIGLNLGRHSRHELRKTSPYATLLLDLSLSLTADDVANIKLALQCDKITSKREMCHIKCAGDVIRHIEEKGLISRSDTWYLQHLLVQLKRMDLDLMIQEYHTKRLKQDQCAALHSPQSHGPSESTFPKLVHSSQTCRTVPKPLKEKLTDIHDASKFTRVHDRDLIHYTQSKQLLNVMYMGDQRNPKQLSQSNHSRLESVDCLALQNSLSPRTCTENTMTWISDNRNDPSSQDMSVDGSQKSLSDEEKISFLFQQDKMQHYNLDNCSTVMEVLNLDCGGM